MFVSINDIQFYPVVSFALGHVVKINKHSVMQKKMSTICKSNIIGCVVVVVTMTLTIWNMFG